MNVRMLNHVGIDRDVSIAVRLDGARIGRVVRAIALGSLLYFAQFVETASRGLGMIDDVLLYAFIVLAPTKYWARCPAALDSIWRIAFWGFLCALSADWYLLNHSYAHCGNPASLATRNLFLWLPLLLVNYILFRRVQARNGWSVWAQRPGDRRRLSPFLHQAGRRAGLLVVPRQVGEAKVHGHLASFLRGAPEGQTQRLVVSPHSKTDQSPRPHLIR